MQHILCHIFDPGCPLLYKGYYHCNAMCVMCCVLYCLTSLCIAVYVFQVTHLRSLCTFMSSMFHEVHVTLLTSEKVCFYCVVIS